jgi:hypothetical protein
MKKKIVFAALALCGLMTITTTARAGENFIVGSIESDGTIQHPNGPTDKLFTVTLGGFAGSYLITFAPNVFGKLTPGCIVMPVAAPTRGGAIPTIVFAIKEDVTG